MFRLWGMVVLLVLALMAPAQAGLLASRRTLVVTPSGNWPDSALEMVQQSCTIWNTVIGRPVLLVQQTDKPDVWLTRVYVYGADRTLAQTHYPYNTSLVTIRDDVFYDSIILRRVVTHELGHVLGLDHNPSSASVMFAAIDYKIVNGAELPDQHDIKEARYRWLY